MSIKITEQNFDTEVLQSAMPVVVDFWADWCGPCKMLGPTVETLAERYDGKARVGKINVDEEVELAMEFGVASIPTLVVIRNGETAGTLVGVQSKERVLELLG